MALNDLTTWAPPLDPEGKRLFYASGRRPYSVWIGGKWIPLAYFGPFALALAIPAAAKHAWSQNPDTAGKGNVSKATRLVGSLARFYSEATPMQGLANMFEIFSGGQDYENAIAKATGLGMTQLVPMGSFTRYINGLVDPVIYKAHDPKEAFERDFASFDRSHLTPYYEPNGMPSTRNWTDYLLPFTVGKGTPEAEQKYTAKMETQYKAKENNAQLDQYAKMLRHGVVTEDQVDEWMATFPRSEKKRLKSLLRQKQKRDAPPD
jgi:hypothetical protein